MTVKINLKKAERKVLPEADYILLIDKSEQRKAKTEAGHPTLHLEYLVDPDTHPEFAGVRLFSDMSLQEQSWFRVVEILAAATGELVPLNEEGDFEFEPDDLVGSKVAAVVTVDDSYDGVPRNRVGTVYSVDQYGEGEPGEGEET